jgi:transposase
MGTHRYPEEFRREAVELYRSSGRPRCRVAESLGISDGSLAAWVAEFDARDEPGALSGGERAELARLRKELAEVKQEREILRKAAQYFAKETTR